MVHTSFVLVVLHRFQQLEGFFESCNPLVPTHSSHTRKPGQPLGCKAQSCSYSPAPTAKLGTSQRQAPKQPLPGNPASYPAPFPGSALSQEPQS